MYAFAIWVTTKCNMRCSYCYEGNDKDSHFMDKKTADEEVLKTFGLEKYAKTDVNHFSITSGTDCLLP